MHLSVTSNNPRTFYIAFSGWPHFFFLTDQAGEKYFFRWLDGKTPRIKFNIPDEGVYTPNVDIQVIKSVPIEIPSNLPTLPPAERSRVQEPEVIFNQDYDGIARNYTSEGVIELGQKWARQPYPIRLFILLHEKWHMLYMTEEYCDLGAMVDFLRMGYNQSTAFYALRNVLSGTTENESRIDTLFENLQKISS